jgi:lipoprotein-anchoring transpeptidase ErfK/SrfK
MRERSAWVWAVAAAVVMATGCQDRDAQRVPADGTATPPAGGQAAQAPDRQAELRLEITLSERQLRVYRGGELAGTHEVAVGDESEHPTPTGEYTIHQVDWNPDWRPPDSDWAADEEYREPGHPENPMGRARLIFEEPYSIHGTDDLESLGRAASHGSVRVANEVVLELARLVMEASGDGESEEWYRQARENRTEMRQVRLSRPVPLTIRE